MGPNTQKSMFYLMGTLLAIYPIIDIVFFKKIKWYVKAILVVIILVFVLVAFSVKGIEDAQRLAEKKKSDSAYKEQKDENAILIKKDDTTQIYLQHLQELIKTADIPGDKKKVINNYIQEVKTLNEN
jgi:hypothetical protein